MHCLVLLLVDLILIFVSTLAAIVLCSTDAALPALAAAGTYAAITLAVAVPVLLLSRLNRTVWRFTSLSDSIRVVGAAAVIVLVADVAGRFVGRPAVVTQGLPVMQGLLMLYMLVGVRVAMRVRHDARARAKQSKSLAGAEQENVLIVGLSPLTDLFLYCAARNGQGRVNIVGILSEAGRHRGRLLRSRKILGHPEAIDAVLHDLAVHGIFVNRIVMASPVSELTEKARAELRRVESRGEIRVLSLSADYGLSDGTSGTHKFATAPDADAIPLPPNPYLRWKRLIDATVALVCTIAFAPLMLAVFFAVLLNVGGPAIFWQQRPGARGRPIKVLKFRTMGPARDRDGRRLTDDERVSRVGRLLRRLRLDELPQVYNVLFGHMSLVGPRPLLPIDQPSAPGARLQLRPGLTGWAQIKGGREISSEDKAALDLWYIRNASFSLDVMILAHTVRMIVFGERVDRNAIHEAWQTLRNEQTPLLAVDGPEHNAV